MSEQGVVLSREQADTYAEWFRALSDGRRVQILNVLATRLRPMTVKEIVAEVDIGQSTVSHHLKVLSETRFVLVEHRGTSSFYRVNEACLTCFPTAADVVMGRLPVGFDAVGAAPGAPSDDARGRT
jgi:DNA-binding transcriptional ArsR family regulator